MTIRHMEILKTIAETGSFTKAARVLYITQSAISHAVRELEEESGTVLFDRLSKSVRLTEAGSLLLRETLPVLAACNALEKRMRHLEQHAPVHLVSSITIATYYLPCALRSFSLTHPDISISVDVVSAANALLVLQAGEADFALIEGLPPSPGALCQHPLFFLSAEGRLFPGLSLQQTTDDAFRTLPGKTSSAGKRKRYPGCP